MIADVNTVIHFVWNANRLHPVQDSPIYTPSLIRCIDWVGLKAVDGTLSHQS
jgi:hypothetical protein